MLAPSGDNCQPWRFRWDGEALRVVFLPERAESLYDVRFAASWISLGAVLTNMAVASRQLGLELEVELFPSGEAARVVTRSRFRPGPAAGDPLHPAISRRCVNRRPYRAEPVPGEIRDELLAIGSSVPRVALDWVETAFQKRRLASLAARNDRILFENRALHDGLYRWLRWTPAEALRTRDGMPIETLELAPHERPGFRLLGSWRCARLFAALGLTRMLPARARRIYRRSGAMALLTVDGQQPEDFVRGGEVLERIWLTATLRNVAVQPITGVTFLLLRLSMAGGEGLGPAHRRLLADVEREFLEIFPGAAGRKPAMLFRLGLGPPPSGRTLRLPLEQVLSVELSRG